MSTSMQKSTPNTSNQPPGVLDEDGYAVCPDCYARINCGTAGLSNLNLQHRGTKKCRETAAKRDKNMKKSKNQSILAFMKPKPIPIPSTVASVGILHPSSSIAPQNNVPAVISKLRSLTARLPATIPNATPSDDLAIFGCDPVTFDNPDLLPDEIWEDSLNKTLKSVLGWSREKDLTQVIRQGPLGMDGLLSFVEYFVVTRGVSEVLFEAKLEYLIETLQALTDNHIPAEGNRSFVHDVIDIDDFEVRAVTSQPTPPNKCKGYTLPIPDGQTPHSSYPFALHDSTSLPWDYAVIQNKMILHAHACDLTPGAHESCFACRNLSKNSIIIGILERMEHGIAPNTKYMYHGFSSLCTLVRRGLARVRQLQLTGLNQARKLIGQSTTLSDYKRLTLAIASGKYERVDRLMHIAVRQRRGVRGILSLYNAAAKGVYKPKSFTEEDDMRGILLWRLGGNRIAHIAHRALGLPSLTTLRTRSVMPPIIISPSQPTIEEVRKNTESSIRSVAEYFDGSVVHVVLMLDEIATERRFRWDNRTNNFLGVCREHSERVALQFTTEQDLEELFRSQDEGDIHAAAEATIGALGVLSDNHRLYPARPIVVSADCKKETGTEHARFIQNLADGVNAAKSITNFRIVSYASDGETRRGSALVELTFKAKLSRSSNIFPFISPLALMNQFVGDDDITADKDWKHVIKRFRNLLLRQRGIVVLGLRITPSIIRLHLQAEGLSSAHINSVLNPEDQQDVKLAFDLLKDIWSLSPAPEDRSPGFRSARTSLRVLGRLLYSTVFPYICVDLTLSEQIEHLSTAIHIALALYRQAQDQFFPTLLYVDLAIMVKNVIFCVAKAKVDRPLSSFWIMLLGTDRLEELFGVLRTMVGTDANLDVLQIGDRITGTVEVLNILAKHPEWDRSPRRLKLPVLTQDSRELPNTADHIKPGSWKGNTAVKDVSLQTSWKLGRNCAENVHPRLAEELKNVDACANADILAPFGKLLVKVELAPDDIDESLDLSEATSPELNSIDMNTDTGQVEVENAFIEEDDDSDDTLASNTIMPAQPPTRFPRGFDPFISIDGKSVSKARALSLRSKYTTKASSTDRLKRVQGAERYTKNEDINTSFGSSIFGELSLMNHDPIATLAISDGRIWLCLGEVNSIKHDTQMVESISLELMAEPTVTVSFQVLGLRPATSNDDPTMQHDWRSYSLSFEKTCTVPGRLVHPLDADYETPTGHNSYYLFKSSVLIATTATLNERLAASLRKLVTIPRTKDFPYRKRSVLRRTRLKEIMKASALAVLPSAHILYDSGIRREEEPCGLCLRSSLICKIYLAKGKGAKGSLRVDKRRSTGCANPITFTYSVAAESRTSSPCSNVPLVCPLCPKSAPAVWRYNWKYHFANSHPHATYRAYASDGELSPFEKDQEKIVWINRKKVPVKRVMKKKGLAPLEVSASHTSQQALSGPLDDVELSEHSDTEHSSEFKDGQHDIDEDLYEDSVLYPGNSDWINDTDVVFHGQNSVSDNGDTATQLTGQEQDEDSGTYNMQMVSPKPAPTTIEDPGLIEPQVQPEVTLTEQDALRGTSTATRSRRKRKERDVGNLKECLCGETVELGEDTIQCSRDGCGI
ncbi:hypothetical protein H0H93_001364, partial [Arthromyces matolae]